MHDRKLFVEAMAKSAIRNFDIDEERIDNDTVRFYLAINWLANHRVTYPEAHWILDVYHCGPTEEQKQLYLKAEKAYEDNALYLLDGTPIMEYHWFMVNYLKNHGLNERVIAILLNKKLHNKIFKE